MAMQDGVMEDKEKEFVVVYLGDDGYNKFLSRHSTVEEARAAADAFNGQSDDNLRYGNAWVNNASQLERILAMPRQWRFEMPIAVVVGSGGSIIYDAEGGDQGWNMLGQDPDEVIDTGTIRVRFDYPLSKPVVFELPFPEWVEHQKKGDWTVGIFIYEVCSKYDDIYEEEDASTSVKPGRAGQLFNRNQTDGKYGIWGHDIGDLQLDGFSKGNDGVWILHTSS